MPRNAFILDGESILAYDEQIIIARQGNAGEPKMHDIYRRAGTKHTVHDPSSTASMEKFHQV